MPEIKRVIQCDCCQRVVAEVHQDGAVVVKLRHNKETHVTRLPVEINRKQ